MNQGVDIIIPVYNSIEDLKLCIDSIKKHTDLKKSRVIIVDDKSSDTMVVPYLKTIEEDSFYVIYSEKNEGFSASVNKGIQYSKRDVILLNSDTIVTKGWVEKITSCAYSEDSIGTVTPLSNAATLCSVPKFCEDNPIPEGFTIDSYAEVIEECSVRRYPQITVAVGFCMYIKRCVIDDIGLFDAETFQKGYGEENDFCNRAEQFGYKHIMCDDTFIYHKGTGSFDSEEKKKLVAEHTKILFERYEEQMKKNSEYVNTNPDQDIRDNLEVYTALHNNKKNLLYVLQSDFAEDAEDHMGGTQFHVKDLTEGLKYIFNIFVVARDGRNLRLTIYAGNYSMVYFFPIGEQSIYPIYSDKTIRKNLQKIIDTFRIDLVHVHHVMSLSMDIFEIAREKKLPIGITLHDYYMICPSIRLLTNKEEFCPLHYEEDKCKECLEKRLKNRTGIRYVQKWREQAKQVFEGCYFIVVPSQSAKEIFIQFYPEQKDKIIVISHAINMIDKSEQGAIKCIKKKKNGRLNVAFVGGLSVDKGALIAKKLINKIDFCNWYLFGNTIPQLKRYRKKNFYQTGPYNRENLSKMIDYYQIDIICILPIWAETFSYTVSEAIVYGIPIIGTDIGAVGERIKDLQCGWVVCKEKAVEEIEVLLKQMTVAQMKNMRIKVRLAQNKLKTIEDMVKEYEVLYQKQFCDDITYGENSQEYIFEHLKLNHKKNGDLIELEIAQKNLKLITSSNTYKLISPLIDLDFPGRKLLRRVIMRNE